MYQKRYRYRIDIEGGVSGCADTPGELEHSHYKEVRSIKPPCNQNLVAPCAQKLIEHSNPVTGQRPLAAEKIVEYTSRDTSAISNIGLCCAGITEE